MRLNLKVFRITHKIKQIEMAKALNVGISTYNSIENGMRDGKLKFWNALKDKFNLTGEQLCELQKKQTTQGF